MDSRGSCVTVWEFFPPGRKIGRERGREEGAIAMVGTRGCMGLAFSKANRPGLFEKKARKPGRAHRP